MAALSYIIDIYIKKKQVPDSMSIKMNQSGNASQYLKPFKWLSPQNVGFYKSVILQVKHFKNWL